MPGVCLLLTEPGLEAKQDLADQQGAEINYADSKSRQLSGPIGPTKLECEDKKVSSPR